MSFIRKKEIPPKSGNWYAYEVETYREAGHVRQRVLRYIGKTTDTLIKHKTNKTKTDNARPRLEITCPKCNGHNIRRYGLYKVTQYYFCNDCNIKFRSGIGFKKKYPENIKCEVLLLRQQGLSYRSIRESIYQSHAILLSRMGIRNWCEENSGGV